MLREGEPNNVVDLYSEAQHKDVLKRWEKGRREKEKKERERERVALSLVHS